MSTHSKEEMADHLHNEVREGRERNRQVRGGQLVQLINWMKVRLLGYYELYDVVLDSSPHFVMEGIPLTIIPQ